MTPEEIANSLEAMIARRDAYGGSHAPLMEGEKYALQEAVRVLRLQASQLREASDTLKKIASRANDGRTSPSNAWNVCADIRRMTSPE